MKSHLTKTQSPGFFSKTARPGSWLRNILPWRKPRWGGSQSFSFVCFFFPVIFWENPWKKTNEKTILEKSRCFFFLRFLVSNIFVGNLFLLCVRKMSTFWFPIPIDSFKLGPKFGITTWPRPSALGRGLHRGLVDEYVAFARRAERCFHWVRGPGRWATKRRKWRLKRKLL